MSKAKQCDRCGRFYTKYLKNRITIRREHHYERVTQETNDLCPDCMEAFDNYMTSAAYEKNRNERHFYKQEVKDET